MRQFAEMFANVTLYLGVLGLLLLAAIGIAALLKDSFSGFMRQKSGHTVALAALMLCGLHVGGQKAASGRVSTGNDPYIVDAGSFVTNDYVHVAVSRRFDFVPMSTEILIYSRELSLTNEEDWVRLVRAEEGPYRLHEFPLDIPFPCATNYNFLVAANYVPEPTVHTNGVWRIKGFIVPDSGGKMAFPNTKTLTKGDTE